MGVRPVAQAARESVRIALSAESVARDSSIVTVATMVMMCAAILFG